MSLQTFTTLNTMNEQIPALVIFHAVVFAITTLTLTQRVQPPTVAPVMCPTHTQSISEKAPEPEPATAAEETPDALNFNLPK